MTKIETLRSTCAAYNEQVRRHERYLQQTIADLAITRMSRGRTESTIAANATKAITYIDATLLDGTAVRMEAQQLLLHQTSEIERLEAMRDALEVRVAELRRFDPGADQAARILQSRYALERSVCVLATATPDKPERCHAATKRIANVLIGWQSSSRSDSRASGASCWRGASVHRHCVTLSISHEPD